MKKIRVIFILLLLVMPLVIQVVKAQNEDQIPGLPSALQGKDPDEIIEDTKNKTLTKWEYLSKEWKNILRRNAVYAPIDKFFTNNNNIFKFLFGMNYDLSFVLIVAMVWWVFFAIWIGKFFHRFEEWLAWKKVPPQEVGSAGKILPFLVGIFIATVLGNLQILWLLAKLIDWIIFFYSGFIWMIVSFVIAIFIFIFISKFFSGINSSLKKSLKDMRDANSRKEARRLDKKIEDVKEETSSENLKKKIEAGKSEEEKDEEKLVREFGKELNKGKGEGELESDDFDVPDFDKP